MNLLQRLNELQAEHGWLPQEALRELSRAEGIALYRLQEVATFYPHYRLQPPPGRKVHVQAAILGALVAGALWGAIGWGFASLVVTSTRNELVYSSFAIVVLFVTWLYIGWLIFLVGYLWFFLAAFWVHDLGDARRQARAVAILWGFAALLVLVFGVGLRWI